MRLRLDDGAEETPDASSIHSSFCRRCWETIESAFHHLSFSSVKEKSRYCRPDFNKNTSVVVCDTFLPSRVVVIVGRVVISPSRESCERRRREMMWHPKKEASESFFLPLFLFRREKKRNEPKEKVFLVPRFLFFCASFSDFFFWVVCVESSNEKCNLYRSDSKNYRGVDASV